MSTSRTLLIGRKAELEELRRARRLEIDVMVSAVRDKLGIRDADLGYTEKIDVATIKVYMKEIERKHNQLAKIVKDLEIVNGDLGESQE